jgi:hypothetical protein
LPANYGLALDPSEIIVLSPNAASPATRPSLTRGRFPDLTGSGQQARNRGELQSLGDDGLLRHYREADG